MEWAELFDRARAQFRGRRARLTRRLAALGMAGTAVVLTILPAPARGDPTAATLVAVRDLPAGTVLTPADVRVAEMPVPLVPAGALRDPPSVDGKLLAGAARAGEPLTDARLVSWAAAEPGMSTVPVRLADAGVAGLLHPGVKVDVVTGGEHEPGRRVLASTVTVSAITDAVGDTREGDKRTGKGPLVLLTAPVEVATQVAAASLGRPVTVTLR
ncbi:Flp pilus assembly protein CpaB [Amycolatopsis suaedae]|uniref:SAF domain-containing protein n=1 Tax=Amycolatopsis suaedae TaxID=2510978 RepID=A0A4V2EM07_9PSEU|nr:SAF domain-containing protein [Amycolatopsis suaedae]RZQ63405.1 hypothetical protein EWH70_13230 [Amycolatopsis suaedae]